MQTALGSPNMPSINAISILIPTHNRSDMLRRTLDSLAKVEAPAATDIEVIIVANACSDDTVAVAEACFTDLPFPGRVVEEPTPGLNHARNRCVQETTADVCAFVDDDVRFEPDWLVEIAKLYNGSEHVDIAGGRIVLEFESETCPAHLGEKAKRALSENDLGPENKEVTELRHVYVVGANFTCRRALFDELGLFRKDLDRQKDKLLGGGETEFVMRAADANKAIWYAGRSMVYHWAPLSRTDSDYLERVSFWSGYTNEKLHKKRSLLNAVRAWCGYYHLRRNAVKAERRAVREGDEQAAFEAKLEERRRSGAMQAIVHREAFR